MDVFRKIPVQFNGVALQGKRVFVSCPAWNKKPKFSVGLATEREVVPYPSLDENNMFTDVNSIHVNNDRLYVVDKNQLVVFNLNTSRLSNIYKVKGSGKLNDIRIVGDNAFLTDSDLGALVVINLRTGVSKIVLKGSDFTKAEVTEIEIDGEKVEATVNADGIEITPDQKSLIFTKPFGGHIYKILLEDLLSKKTDEELEEGIEDLGMIPPHGGICMLEDGSLLWSDVVNHSIQKRSPDGTDEVVLQDDILQWPDALVKEGEYVYVPCAQYNVHPPKAPFNLIRFKFEE